MVVRPAMVWFTGVSRMEKINNYFRQLSLSALETMLERLFPGGTYPRDWGINKDRSIYPSIQRKIGRPQKIQCSEKGHGEGCYRGGC